MFRLGLSARAPSHSSQSRARLKAQVARVMALASDVVISITEISCGAANCPDAELVILILREGAPPQVAKLHGPMDRISDESIVTAFVSRAEEEAQLRRSA
jgi:hypothetical protein